MIYPDNLGKKHSLSKRVFFFCVRAIFWAAGAAIIGPLLIALLLFYFHLHPYGYEKFDKSNWLAGLKGEGRCEVAGTVVKNVLKPGMTRSDVEKILGPEKDIYYIRDDKTREYAYYLGWCSPLAWDPYSLIILYDLDDHLIEAYNMQH